jgi:hypothetical protein
MLSYRLVLLFCALFASICRATPINPEFRKIVQRLWQTIQDANFDEHTTVKELDEKISPLLTSNNMSKKGFEYLQQTSITAETLKSYRAHRFLKIHNKNQRGRRRADRGIAKVRTVKFVTQKPSIKHEDKEIKRKTMIEEANAIDLSALAKRIQQTGLGTETDPRVFIRHEEVLSEVWSKKRFTNLLAEYMKTYKGISDYAIKYSRARKNAAKARRRNEQSDSADATSRISSSSKNIEPVRLAYSSTAQSALQHATVEPRRGEIRRMMVHNSESDDEWVPNLGKGKRKALWEVKKPRTKRLKQLSDTGSGAVYADSSNEVTHQDTLPTRGTRPPSPSHTIVIVPDVVFSTAAANPVDSDEVQRYLAALSRPSIVTASRKRPQNKVALLRPATAAKRYKGAEDILTEETPSSPGSSNEQRSYVGTKSFANPTPTKPEQREESRPKTAQLKLKNSIRL